MRILYSNDERTVVNQRNSENRNRRCIGILMILFGILLTGCVSVPTRTYKREIVNTYAELNLLYEKEKMVNKLTDSSYQILVKEFFVKKGLEQDEYKEQVEELSKNPQVWKFFIQDVSGAIDSLKAIKQPIQ